MKKTAGIIGTLIIAAMIVAAGCGGGGSSVAPQTVTGAVRTPGGTTNRIAGRTASALANVSIQVDIIVSSPDSSGALTQIATVRTDSSGNFSLTLPIGTTVTGNLIVASASVGGNTLRAFLTSTTGEDISPITEAAVQIVEQALPTTGNYSVISPSEADAIQSDVESSLANETFDSSADIASAVTAAQNTAISDINVQSSISSAITGTTTVAVATTSDYSSGGLSALYLTGSLSSTQTAIINITTVSGDPVIRTDGTYVYILNRMNFDSIQVFDPSNSFSVVIPEYSTGNGSNPQDIEFISSAKAYVSLYGKDYILVLHPTDSSATTSTIDLSAFADSDGFPEISQMVTVGTKVFVIVQNLVNWAPAGTSRIVVIDTATDSVVDTDASIDGVQAISLVGQNPQFITYNADLGKILISCSGSYFDSSVQGGIDVIDPVDYSVSQLVSRTSLGGNAPGALVIASTTKGYIVTTDTSYTNYVMSFNPTTGEVNGTAVYTTTGYIPSLAIDPFDYLVVPDQLYTNPGLVFINTSTDTVAQGPISVGLPPTAITFVTYNK